MNRDPRQWHVGLVGYGEVGRILAEDLRAQGLTVDAHDLKLARPDSRGDLPAHGEAHGVRLHERAAEAVAHADLVISAVTASQAVVVAQACAAHLPPGGFFLDLNSASPGASGTAERQAWVADLADSGVFGRRGEPTSRAATTGASRRTASSARW